MKILVPDRWKIELSGDGGYYQEAFSIGRLISFAKEQGTTLREIVETIKSIMIQLGFDVQFCEQKEGEEFVVNVLFGAKDIGVALNFIAGEFITLNELIMQAAINKGKELAKNNIVYVNVDKQCLKK